MTTYRVNGPDGQSYDVQAPDSATPDQVQQFISAQLRPAIDTSVTDANDARAKANPGVAPLLRRIGLPESVGQSVDQWAGRNEGAIKQQQAETMTGLGASALRGFTDLAVIGPVQAVANLTPWGDDVNKAVLADEARYQELRQRAGKTGFDAGRAIGGAGAVVAPSRLLSPFKGVPVGSKTGQVVAGATMGQRAGNAAVQGAAAGAAMPVLTEDGYFGEKAKQIAIGGAAGMVLAPVLEPVVRGAVAAINAGSRAFGAVRDMVRSVSDIDAAIQSALNKHAPGVEFSKLRSDIQQSLRDQVAKAGNLEGLNPAEIARTADIAAVGATPTRGTATLDPVLISREKNLAKMGANSDDPALQAMARREGENNAALINSVNRFAGGAPDAYGAGQAAVGAVKSVDDRAKAAIATLYKRARDMNGGDIPLDAGQAIQDVFRKLELEGKLPFLGENAAVLNKIVSGEFPLTVGTAEGLKSTLSNSIRSAQDGNSRYALQQAYNAIENAAPAAQLGADAQAAFRQARNAAKARFDLIEKSPAYAAVVDGIEPDKFVQRFIIGQSASLNDVLTLRTALTRDPAAFAQVRLHVADWIKSRAINGAPGDDVAKFSQSAYNKALDAIGDRKLAAFFSKQELAELRQIGRAASYLQFQPVGSAVNNSNSGALVAAQANNMLNRLANSRLVGMLPFGNVVRGAAQGGANVAARDAASAEARGLLNPLGLAPKPQLVNPDGIVGLLGPVGAATSVTLTGP